MNLIAILLYGITLTWTHPGGEFLNGFKVYTGVSQDGPWTEVGDIDKNDRQATLPDPTSPTYYGVAAYDNWNYVGMITIRNEEGAPVYGPFLVAPADLTAGP